MYDIDIYIYLIYIYTYVHILLCSVGDSSCDSKKVGFGAAVASLRGAKGLWIKAFDLLKSNSARRHRVALLFLLFVKGPFSCGRVSNSKGGIVI